jgi:putative transposase
MNRKEVFSNGEVYHIFNRGVEKRSVFINDHDYLRFLHSVAEFNGIESAENIFYKKEHVGSYEVKPRKMQRQHPLVEILAFTLLPNHYHLLLKQNREGGISEFMQKLGTGYTMYFNKNMSD